MTNKNTATSTGNNQCGFQWDIQGLWLTSGSVTADSFAARNPAPVIASPLQLTTREYNYET